MADNQERLNSLQKKKSALDKKIETFSSQRKKIEKQINDIEEREYMNIIKENECTIPTLKDDLALIRFIKESNLSHNDVIELIRDLGGQNNEET